MVFIISFPPRNPQIHGFLCVLYSLNSPIVRCDIALTLAFWQHLESKSNSLSHSGASGSLDCESELDFHSKNRRFARVSSSLTPQDRRFARVASTFTRKRPLLSELAYLIPCTRGSEVLPGFGFPQKSRKHK